MLEVIFLSDSKISDTDIPSRLSHQISLEKDINIHFFTLSYSSFIKIFRKFINHFFNKKKLIINTHHFKGAFFIFFLKIIFIKNKYSNIKWVHTFHAESRRFKGIKKLMNLITYKKCDQLIGVSKGVSNGWIQFLNNKNITTILNGISQKEYSIITKTKIFPSNTKRLLWVGRLEKIKDPLMLIDALKNLKNSEPISLKIIGNGSLHQKLIIKIHQFLVTNKKNNIKIELLSNLSRKEVLIEFTKANIYINTSKSEAFCTSALEAFVNKYCFLVIPSFETLKLTYDYKNVEFYKPESPKDLANKLDKLIFNNSFNRKSENYKNFPEKFKLKFCSKEYVKLYKNVFK